MTGSSKTSATLLALALAFGVALPASATVLQQDSMSDQKMMVASSDKKFAMEAAHGGMMEIDMARMALDRASSDDVKQYAQKMIDDHTKAGDELSRIASMKGIMLPTATDPDHMKKMESHKADMMKVSGADFDRKYMAMQEKMHSKMATTFENESTKGKDADIKMFAANTLPTVRSHWKMARDWNVKMKGMKDSK